MSIISEASTCSPRTGRLLRWHSTMVTCSALLGSDLLCNALLSTVYSAMPWPVLSCHVYRTQLYAQYYEMSFRTSIMYILHSVRNLLTCSYAHHRHKFMYNSITPPRLHRFPSLWTCACTTEKLQP
ncbi:hypothetical protein BU24DRAFT_154258 [Aaosphaeria arxii CBS 175.79]|uniref:Uncharacterized protein n=1 Tax=Aaosphaeria arxii CBS 175.79 TaxID=1450172 RepID=A0A6A5XWA8_9PLEO|nr:uncharacterized protein BU24DRAFT_154258 [Aaosphaeria arxii CBS 175.79]KAF2017615.1 hypothetical protein BU24DRAFT_154258 [Aaosphaeria arxii CBS 175.79]